MLASVPFSCRFVDKVSEFLADSNTLLYTLQEFKAIDLSNQLGEAMDGLLLRYPQTPPVLFDLFRQSGRELDCLYQELP